MDMSGMSDTPSAGFIDTQNTPLYSSSWVPSSSSAYAGTCIFLIILAIIGRGLVAFKTVMEQRWLAAALDRRYVLVAGKTPEAAAINSNPEAKTASLVTAQGVEESVKVVHRVQRGPLPWRFSVDLPRALLYLCIAGVGYLLLVESIPSTLSIGGRTVNN
jgi:Ctr copper transporter family